ncbi:MAG: prephenate dehydrogenase/arogenate dehydrogenase family protein [Dehalococcoidia bacterium]|nr:prephenate dehydrogenase/arogenate dehydrogenase family protein [Dehalococcoidia bacterium]
MTMRIAIIGLGLIGGSIGLSLKRDNWRDAEIIGYARRRETGSLALKLGAVDKAELDLRKAVKYADIVIIAAPVLAIKDIFKQIAPVLSDGSIVTDTASTKVQVMQWAEELLPSKTSFVGGHPMAGKEISGIRAAKDDLFHNCIYCLTPLPQTKPAVMRIVKDMVNKLGAIPIIIEAEEHDRLVAGISHLPLLLSVALVSVTTKNPSWQQMSCLAASGYRDLTRLASGNPEVSAHICLSNQAAIVSWIDAFIDELEKLRKLISDGSDEIEEALALANEARQKWLEKRC